MEIFRLQLAILLCFITHLVNAQITLDYVDTNNTHDLGGIFYPVDIDNNETKYVLIDTVNNQFDIFNMDFSPFMTNIQLPGAFNPNFSVMYVSRSLFDCDSSNIEYVYSAPFQPAEKFQVLRSDGTVLFSQDSTFGIYCIGCLGGSNDIRPIRKTSAGTKMFLGKYVPSNTLNNVQIQIYSVCGTLPVGYTEIFNPLLSAAKVYPNPTSNEVIFDINLPSNVSKYDLTIYDQNGKEIIKEHDLNSNRHTLAFSKFSSGIYFYSLTNNNKPFATGKIVSTK